MDYKEAYEAMAVVMGTDQPRKAEAVAECWTCNHTPRSLTGPACGCGRPLGTKHPASLYVGPRVQTHMTPEYHRSVGHDVRPVGDAEAQTRSVCGRCHGLAAVEDCVVCSAVAKHRAEAQGVKP